MIYYWIFRTDESALEDVYQIRLSRTMALLSLNRSLCCRYRLLFPHGYDVVCSHSGYSSDKVSLLLQDLSSLGFTCSINFETMCKSLSLQNSKKDPLSFLNSSTCSFPETRNIMLASENDIRFLFLKIIKTNALYQLNSHEKLCKRWDLKKAIGTLLRTWYWLFLGKRRGSF